MSAALPEKATITTIEVTGVETLTLEKSGVYHVNLMQPGAEVEVSGVFEAKNKEIVDVTIVLNHMAPHTKANTLLKGVAKDSAQVRFVGRIIIEEECGDSNSFLTERILLLSDTAKAEAVPDLEIKTDDVKCSHAASISRIPEEHVFYLMSRGLAREAAQQLIIDGFLQK